MSGLVQPTRRSLLAGLGTALIVAPSIVRATSLMRINPRLVPMSWPRPSMLLRSPNYILRGRRVERCDDLLVWGSWFEKTKPVGATIIDAPGREPAVVSTVFLGIDHGLGRLRNEMPPVLFETMVFGPDGNERDCQRYCTYDEAEAGHRAAVDRLTAAVPFAVAVTPVPRK